MEKPSKTTFLPIKKTFSSRSKKLFRHQKKNFFCIKKKYCCKSVDSHRDRKGPGRETQNCRHFWTRVGSSHLKSVNSHRDRKGPGRETQNCRHCWTRIGPVRETQNLIIVPSKPSFCTPSSSPSGYPSPTSKNR